MVTKRKPCDPATKKANHSINADDPPHPVRCGADILAAISGSGHMARLLATRLSHRHWPLHDVPHLGALSVWALAGFAVVAYCFNWPALQRTTVAALHPVATAKASANSGTAGGIHTGSILFVPPRGELCGQWIFDNRTGAMWDNGLVSCRPASASSEPDSVTLATRMMAIGKAFKGD
jgi:hypothetical protein